MGGGLTSQLHMHKFTLRGFSQKYPSSASVLIATADSVTAAIFAGSRRARNNDALLTAGTSRQRLVEKPTSYVSEPIDWRQCGPRVTDQGYRLVILAGSDRHSNFTRCAICVQASEWVELYKRARHRDLTRRPRIQLGARPKNRVF